MEHTPTGGIPLPAVPAGDRVRQYALRGALLGLAFPLLGTAIEAATRHGYLGFGAALLDAQTTPLMWMVDAAPLLLGFLAARAGRREDELVAKVGLRRRSALQTARDLSTTAQRLLANVSAFSSMTAETAASVRDTTSTMAQLGQTATQAAITAEIVIGLARQGKKFSDEGLHAVEAATAEMTKLADEVRGLSKTIEALNGRMRDIFEIATVVNYIAERSQRLAEKASADLPTERAASEGMMALVTEVRRHAEDSKKAAAQVKDILGEVHKAMLAAMAAADAGIRRAEQGAQVAAGSGQPIQRLAAALGDSSQAAKEIATFAQQQDHGIEQVLKAMNEIYLATQETMTSTAQVAKEARALNDLASGLRRAVES